MNRHLDFPSTSKVNEETGVSDCTNEMDNGIIYLYIDKVGSEDWIMFHEAEFEIIDGYWYTDGRNETINHVIEDFYNLRLNLKKGVNPAQMVIKLLMNSMYGKQ